MKITLNEGQQVAVNLLVDGFLSKGLKGVTLLGEGGTGKTTCVMAAVEQWLKAGLRVALTAPTNKAVKQLEKAARQYGISSSQVTFCTIHKALGLAMLPSEDTKYAAQVGECTFDNYDIVGIDEGSMISRVALFNYILPEISKVETKLFVMGDKMQLPPVKEQKALALEMHQFPVAELLQVERFSEGSSVAAFTKQMREAIEREMPFKFDAEALGIKAVKPAYFVKEVTNFFDHNTDLDEVRVLAWRNSRVNTVNDAVRKKLYGANIERFGKDERVVTGAPIYEGKDLLLSTDEECIVKAFQKSSLMYEETGKEYNTYMVTLEPIHAEAATVYCHVIHESSEMELREDLNAIAIKAKKTGAKSLWGKYHELKDLFSDLKYCYCITIHRSQGSTFKTVFLDVNDILENRNRQERNKLLYVGGSRTAETLIVSKEKFTS